MFLAFQAGSFQLRQDLTKLHPHASAALLLHPSSRPLLLIFVLVLFFPLLPPVRLLLFPDRPHRKPLPVLRVLACKEIVAGFENAEEGPGSVLSCQSEVLEPKDEVLLVPEEEGEEGGGDVVEVLLPGYSGVGLRERE